MAAKYLQEIRSMLELEIDIEEANAEAEAKVFEGAGAMLRPLASSAR